MNKYLIGDLLVEIEYDGIPVKTTENMEKFKCEERWHGEVLKLSNLKEEIVLESSQKIREDNNIYEVYRHEEETYLVYHWGSLLHGMTIWPERFAVTFSEKMYKQPPLKEDWFFSISAFHKQLLERNAGVLHAAYINVSGEAVLFTGPSNVGKSTQANLWRESTGATIINGDRAVIRKKDNRWHAYGYPCCGTSGICINETLPLKIIVVLEQSDENRVVELTALEKIRALASATEVYPWDANEINMAITFAEEIMKEILIVKLYCRPETEAVEVLKEYMEVKMNGNNI